MIHPPIPLNEYFREYFARILFYCGSSGRNVNVLAQINGSLFDS